MVPGYHASRIEDSHGHEALNHRVIYHKQVPQICCRLMYVSEAGLSLAVMKMGR